MNTYLEYTYLEYVFTRIICSERNRNVKLVNRNELGLLRRPSGDEHLLNGGVATAARRPQRREARGHLRRAALLYHPDKNLEADHGAAWAQLCEQLTRLATQLLEHRS